MTSFGTPIPGQRVFLRSVGPKDEEALRLAELSGLNRLEWRHQGRVLSAQDHHRALWDGVLEQAVACRSRDGGLVGVVAAYRPDLRNGTAWLSVFSMPEFKSSGMIWFATVLFIDRVFENWPLRQLYIETVSSDFGSIQSESVVVEQGCFADYQFVAGEYRDKHIYAIRSEEWHKLVKPRIASVRQRRSQTLRS